MSQQPMSLDTTVTKPARLEYLIQVPEGAPEDERGWPMILFLHGMGERGRHVHDVAKHGPPKMIAAGETFPFVVVSPQCPPDTWWHDQEDALLALLDEVCAAHPIDARRVYLTGLSMGGYGTWYLGRKHPERFAALVPICGGLLPGYDIAPLATRPVWAFHGAQDETVPLRESQRIVEAVQALGGDIRLTVYPEAGHDSWTETYANPALYAWLLAHSLPAS